MPDMLNLGREARIASGFELRRQDPADPFVEFRGYASVTNVPYDVAGGPEMGGWTEIMAPNAFKRDLGRTDNRALLYNHNNAAVLATTRSGSLSMVEDGVGLLTVARLDTRVSWIADLVQQIEEGVVDEMSIGFYAKDATWSKDYNQRTVNAVQLVESTITWAGANGATVAAIERSRAVVVEARAAHAPIAVDRIKVAAAAALALR